MITVGTSLAMTPPLSVSSALDHDRFETYISPVRSPSSHNTIKATLSPSPDLS